MAKRDSRFLLWQKVTVGIIAVAIIVVFGYLYTMVIAEAPLGEFVEGEHYQLIENPRRIRGDNVEVMEFFSYGCIHCYNFDPELNDWVADNEGRINFIRTPAISSNLWQILGRTYFTLDEMDLVEAHHEAFFRAIHELGQRFEDANAIIAFFVDRGVNEAAFRSVFSSAAIDRKIEVADQMARRMKIASVPSIVVHGKYLVRATATIGPSRMLDVMDYLVAKESGDSGAEGSATATEAASPSD